MIQQTGNVKNITIPSTKEGTKTPVSLAQAAQLIMVSLPKLPFEEIERLSVEAKAFVDKSVGNTEDLLEIAKFVFFVERVHTYARETMQKQHLKVSVATNKERVDSWNATVEGVKTKKREKQIQKAVKAWSHESLVHCKAWMEIKTLPNADNAKHLNKFLDVVKMLFTMDELTKERLAEMYNLPQSKKFDMGVVRAHIALL